MKSILLLAMLYASLFAFNGKVVSIHDGDTITVLSGKEQIKVRLYGIDAPEKKQDYGQRSKQFLASLIAGQVIEVEPKGKDRYKRTLGIIYHKDDHRSYFIVTRVTEKIDKNEIIQDVGFEQQFYETRILWK